VISNEITLMLNAVLRPERALLKVSSTVSAVLPVRWKALTTKEPKLRSGLNATSIA
jgi:hypothetical protein